MNLFYTTEISAKIGDLLKIGGDDAHHIDRVLRMNAGETLIVSNGRGEWAAGKIRKVSKKEVEVEVSEVGFENQLENRITVAQALTKSDRAKEALELLTASGVEEIIPWKAARSIGKDSRKWKITSVETGKQARCFWLPEISEDHDFKELISAAKNFDQILICHEAASEPISKVVKKSTKTLIVIGPEGGLTETEIAELTAINGQLVRLGRPILRSAHAGIAAVSAVSALMGNW
ncbi:MAG: hypothetical protein RLZ57_1044 [Actinomycetota bacterium]|jgi:16S rRNA (uracil1498-N3)-methyltransferase